MFSLITLLSPLNWEDDQKLPLVLPQVVIVKDGKSVCI